MSSAEQAFGQLTVIVEQRVQRHPGEISMGPHRVVTGVDADCGDLIEATHYAHVDDEDASPQEMYSGSLPSVAQGDFATHQGIEHYNYMFVRAHLIDKALCSNSVLSPLNKDDSNFLALSPSLHDQFDGRNRVGAETFAIRIDRAHEHPHGQRARVDLLVIPDSTPTSEYLASTLRNYIRVDTAYRVAVHVKDPALFCVCITWKYNKTVKGWREQGRLPDSVDTIDEYNFQLLEERFPGHDLDEE